MSKKSLLEQALAHQQAGRLAKAQALYQLILKKEPRNADALNLAGVLAHQCGNNELAASYIRRAISCKPAFPEAHCNLGNILQAQGDLAAAGACYREALALKPDMAGAYNNLGNLLREQGQADQAIDCYRQALALKPDHVEAHNSLAAALRDRGSPVESVAALRQAIALKPGVAEQHYHLANALKSLGNRDEAMQHYRLSISLRPDYADAHINLGALQMERGQLPQAIETYRNFLAQHPDNASAYCNLGTALKDMGRLDESLAAYREAIAHQPDLAEAHYNQGNVLQMQGMLGDAAQSYQRALEIRPDMQPALNNLGNVLQSQGELDAAERNYRKLLALGPENADAYNNLGNVYKHQSRLDAALASYRKALALKPGFFEAHSNILYALSSHSGCTPEHYLSEARNYGASALAQAQPYSIWKCRPAGDALRRLRVGLVSGDLKSHPVGYFLENVLRHLDQNRFELVAYSTKGQEDALTARIKPYFSAWHIIAGLSDQSAARRVHDDGIDVLVDLAGHTAFNRLPLFAWKPAPVQVSWLGYFASTGLPGMDYLLADPISVPEAQRSAFSEEICYLPDTRLCFTPPAEGDAIPVSALPALQGEGVTLGCFHTLSKISDEVLELWGRVFGALPQARLRLQNKQMSCPATREEMVRRLARFGIPAARVTLLGNVTRAEYLAAHAEVDFILDTFPYPGGTTTCEALWMGVPTLTLCGGSMLARQGASLMTAAGLPDWVANSAEEYVAKALAFSQDLARLAALRAGLREQVRNSPLFDAARFAGNLEAALLRMWEAKCSKSINQSNESGVEMEKVFLHVGCGSNRKDRTTRGFNSDSWRELRLDINQSVNPDIVGTMTDMSAVASESVDAIFSSHNIEHLYPHEVPLALKEFLRVLKPGGFLVVTCPDLQSVCALVANDKLTEPAYVSPAGPIAPLDILYGLRSALGNGNLYMAHRCGFTKKVLIGTLQSCGFASIAAIGRPAKFDLWAIACKTQLNQEEMHRLVGEHFPA